MQLKQLLNDNDAVSPVIGVILMVAITVILAAVIGTFVLGLGDQVQTTAPNAQFSFDYSADNSASGDNPQLDITHAGGDGIAGNELIIRGDVESPHEWGSSDSTIRAGDSVTVDNDGTGLDWASSANPSDGDVDQGTEVRVVWQDSDSEQSSTLRTWTKQ
ncbi:type IV pilin N-terminal domain-containing protein [Natronomonas salina]|uniref:type IV pilin n=1 Tax=Natronomonas salina TaxID=1710540 RepID=UPI0015B5CB72|nr:type IV pilin N-terminal domain-containing protein [Natronomonas salina]QLD90769.1 type IV pilin N-terminal domain-containing protein [Natronomonas salina]